jgi:hypothetical protein
MEVAMDTPILTWSAAAPPDADRWRRAAALLFALALLSWAESGWRQGSGLAVPRASLAITAALMVAAHLAASGVEAAAYVLWWRTRGARLAWAPFFVGLVALSLADRCAASLTALAEHAPALAAWLAPVAGAQLVRGALPGVEPGLWAAFGGLGLLTLARIAATAWLQAAGTGRRLRAALAVTALAWLFTRVAVWWCLDLVRGMSPLP